MDATAASASGSRAFAVCDGMFGCVIKCPAQENGKWPERGKVFERMFFANPPQGGKKGSSPAGGGTRDDISAIWMRRQGSHVYFAAADLACSQKQFHRITSRTRCSR